MKTSSLLFLLAFVSGFSIEQSYAKTKLKLAKPVAEIDSASINPPKDQEVCFSPDEPCDWKLVKFIDTAEKSLDIAIYDLTHDTIAHHILVKSKKIPTRILVDRRQSKGEHSLVRTLIKAGVNVRFGHQRGIMHNKFTIVDGKAIETGSYNYTNNATKNNNENQTYSFNSAVVDRYRKRFDQIWNDGDPAALFPETRISRN